MRFTGSRNVGDVGGDSGGADDVVAGEFGDVGGKLAEEGEGLTDSTGRAENGDFRLEEGVGRVERSDFCDEMRRSA